MPLSIYTEPKGVLIPCAPVAFPIPVLDRYPTLTFREKIALLTVEFLKENQVECPVTHEFSEGTYTRIMRIPRDTLFLGRVHIHGHRCELREGKVIHITPQARKSLGAPFAIHTTPGDQMVLYTLTDIVGATIHPNPQEERDTETLEAQIFETTESLKELGLRVQMAVLEDHT